MLGNISSYLVLVQSISLPSNITAYIVVYEAQIASMPTESLIEEFKKDRHGRKTVVFRETDRFLEPQLLTYGDLGFILSFFSLVFV